MQIIKNRNLASSIIEIFLDQLECRLNEVGGK